MDRVREAVVAAKKVTKDERFMRWSDAWLAGNDPTGHCAGAYLTLLRAEAWYDNACAQAGVDNTKPPEDVASFFALLAAYASCNSNNMTPRLFGEHETHNGDNAEYALRAAGGERLVFSMYGGDEPNTPRKGTT